MDVDQSDIETKQNAIDALASTIVSNNNKFGTNSAAINAAVAATSTGAAATLSATIKEDCKEQLLLLTSSTAVAGTAGSLTVATAASGTGLIATPIGSNALTTLPGAITLATTISSTASGNCSSISVSSSSGSGCANIKSEPSDRLQQSLITPTPLNTATTTISRIDDQMCNVSKSTNLLNSNSSSGGNNSGISGTMNNNNILCNTQNAIGSDSSNTKNESVEIKEEIDRDSPSPMMPPHAASKHLVSELFI